MWSLTIIAIVLSAIWAGYAKRVDIEESVVTETAPKSESKQTVEAQPAVVERVSPPAPEPITLDYPTIQTAPAPDYSPPPYYGRIPYLTSFRELSGVGRIRQPVITPEWLESFERFCVQVARRGPGDCAVQLSLLRRLLAKPQDEMNPWVIEIQEALAERISQQLGQSGRGAFHVSCSTDGCLIFVAASTGSALASRELVERLFEQEWPPSLSIRHESPIGGKFLDESGDWEIVAFERLGKPEGEP